MRCILWYPLRRWSLDGSIPLQYLSVLTFRSRTAVRNAVRRFYSAREAGKSVKSHVARDLSRVERRRRRRRCVVDASRPPASCRNQAGAEARRGRARPTLRNSLLRRARRRTMRACKGTTRAYGAAFMHARARGRGTL